MHGLATRILDRRAPLEAGETEAVARRITGQFARLAAGLAEA